MRLINTTSRKLKEFYGSKTPSYAILSHTWGDDEISFSEWLAVDSNLRTCNKAGYRKIWRACSKARQEGFKYLWADTVCIDKSSSAELSEAINSMFNWYHNAAVCYVYLADVVMSDFGLEDPLPYLEKSRWFTRGWTLQELLAPSRMIFYSEDWRTIGGLMDYTGTKDLSQNISQVTGIQSYYFGDLSQILSASVAQRMSWLSRRNTTREEDMAYCMLGIFGINMPLLYGEGDKAFLRLQEEILKSSNDHSLFCWSREHVPRLWASLLAPFPAAFRDSGQFLGVEPWDKRLSPYAMTNFGLSISLPILAGWSYDLAVLDVSNENSYSGLVAIPLDTQQYGRARQLPRDRFLPWPVSVPHDNDYSAMMQAIYIRHQPLELGELDSNEAMYARAHLMTTSWGFIPTLNRRDLVRKVHSVPCYLFDERAGIFAVEKFAGAYYRHEARFETSFDTTIHYGILVLSLTNGSSTLVLFAVERSSKDERVSWTAGILDKSYSSLDGDELRTAVENNIFTLTAPPDGASPVPAESYQVGDWAFSDMVDLDHCSIAQSRGEHGRHAMQVVTINLCEEEGDCTIRDKAMANLSRHVGLFIDPPVTPLGLSPKCEVVKGDLDQDSGCVQW